MKDRGDSASASGSGSVTFAGVSSADIAELRRAVFTAVAKVRDIHTKSFGFIEGEVFCALRRDGGLRGKFPALLSRKAREYLRERDTLTQINNYFTSAVSDAVDALNIPGGVIAGERNARELLADMSTVVGRLRRVVSDFRGVKGALREAHLTLVRQPTLEAEGKEDHDTE